MLTIWVYSSYLVLGVAFTIWVARTLKHSGRIFVLDACDGREPLADSINHLLNVGFYLINLGYIAAALKIADKPQDPTQAVEATATKVGFVLLVLGGMHFFNLVVLARARRQASFANMPPTDPSLATPYQASARGNLPRPTQTTPSAPRNPA